MDHQTDTTRCPLCGQSNRCIMATSQPDSNGCWCTSVHLSSELMAELPEQIRDLSCLCPGCLSRFAFAEQSAPR